MDEEGMTKYGVVLDDKTKEGSKDQKPDTCPECHKKLDDGGACPTHGTKPSEKKP